MRAPADPPRLCIGEALALGALHGPAELLPISSSAHTDLVPWLLGWEYAELDGELRKSFAVALHVGTAAALAVALRRELRAAVVALDRRRIVLLAGSLAPPAAVGLALERPIERHLGRPRPIAGALAAGGLAMALADRRGAQTRGRDEAGAADALALGIAQACALAPGVSRNGATLAAARLRGFRRADAGQLSRHVALPVIAAAAALKAGRLARRGLPAGTGAAFAAGTGAAFAATLLSVRLVRDDRALWPYSLYRLGLAAWTAARLRAAAARPAP